jgi:hypothetical protein
MLIDTIMSYWAHRWFAVSFYWAPLVLCAIGYLAKTANEIYEDRKARDTNPERYVPKITIGHLIGRALLSICPIGNLGAALFDIAPDMCGGFFKWIGRVFNQPIVPKKTK